MTKYKPIQALYVSTVGSKLYGTSTANSDTDIKGFCLPTLQQLVGLETFEQQEYKNDAPDGPLKIEGQIYSLSKFIYLSMIKQNPTMMEVCFAPSKFHLVMTPLGQTVIDFVKKGAVTKRMHGPYSAYHRAQVKKLQSMERTGKRAEDVQTYGYDPKFAMHAYRLGVQAAHAMKTGEVNPCLEGAELTLAKEIREAKYTLSEVLDILTKVDQDMYASYNASTLPVDPDYDAVNKFLTDVTVKFIKGEYSDSDLGCPLNLDSLISLK